MQKRARHLCLFTAVSAAMLSIALPAFAQTTTINDNDSRIVYSRVVAPSACGSSALNWCYFPGVASDYNGDETSSNFVRASPGNFQGASMALTFIGTSIIWTGVKGPNYGQAFYSIDGAAPTTFDAYNSIRLGMNSNVAISGLTIGYHVLSISASASKNASSTDYWQTIDGFTITGSPVALSSASAGAGWTDIRDTYSHGGHWTCGPNADDLSGGHCWSHTAGDYISWPFTGNLVEVYGRPDAENGYMDVSIDGGTWTRVDLGLGTVDDDAFNSVLIFAKGGLSGGSHTITIAVTGSNNGYSCSIFGGACNTMVQVDELVAFGGGSSSSGSSGSGLANGTYLITSGSNSVDGGYGYFGASPAVAFYATTPTNNFQKWTWNGTTFLNVGDGDYLADGGGGTVTENAPGDTWTVTAANGGYLIQNNRTRNYLTDNSDTLAMSGTATVWTISY